MPLQKNNEIDAKTGANKKKLKKKSKKKGLIIALIILLLIIGAGVAVFGFDVFGIREAYVRPLIQDVPVLNYLLPEKEGEEENELTERQLVLRNKKTEAEKNELESKNSALEDKVKELEKEIARLKVYETEQEQFKVNKENFDAMIASGNKDAYKEFYEGINPETAEQIYKEIISGEKSNSELSDYVKTFSDMKKDAAAKIFEEMIKTDMDLVVRILANIDSTKRGEIISAMKADSAASVVKRLAPKEQQ